MSDDCAHTCQWIRETKVRESQDGSVVGGNRCVATDRDWELTEPRRTQMKQAWVRFGGRSRPVHSRRDRDGKFEGTARGIMEVQADVEIHLVADGRSIGLKEAG